MFRYSLGAVLRRIRLAIVLASLPVGCFDEDTNSATGSFVELTGATTASLDDADGYDGVIVDCSSLFDSNVSVEDESTSVAVSFDAGTAPGTRLDAPANVDVSIVVGTGALNVTGGVIVVDQNDTGIDMRIAVTLENVTTDDGTTVNGQIDCLEKTGDILVRSCFSCDGGGGSGSDGDSD